MKKEAMRVIAGRHLLKRTALAALVFVLCVPMAALAYTVRPVTNGGTISGTVMFTGSPIPRDPVVHPTMDVHYCGRTLPRLAYLIKNRKIQDVVVFIKDIKSGKPLPRKQVVIDNRKCAFVPHIGIGFTGNKLIFRNSDPSFHDIHTYIDGLTYYNLGLTSKGASVTKKLTRPGLIEITCDAHPWMHGWLYSFDNPYAAITNAQGRFVIRNVPPGTYTVEAWHSRLGRVDETNVRVAPGKTATIKFSYSKVPKKH